MKSSRPSGAVKVFAIASRRGMTIEIEKHFIHCASITNFLKIHSWNRYRERRWFQFLIWRLRGGGT
jgi:hypothetical protein